MDRLSQAARRRHAQLRRAESCRRFVNILVSSLHDASDGSVSAACVALDQPELRACLEAAGANVAELRMLSAYRLHNRQLLGAWEARCGGGRGPLAAADTHTHTHTLATLLPLECAAHAFVYGLPPYPAAEAPPAWLEHGVGSGAWLEPPVEPSGAAAAAATAGHHSQAPLPAMPTPAMASPIGALLRRSAALTAPLLFGGGASSGRGFHYVLDAQLRAQAASERAEGAAEDAAVSAEPLLGLPTSAHRQSMKQAAVAAAAATVAAAVAPKAEAMVGAGLEGAVEEEGWDDGGGGAPSRWLLLCRVLRGAPSLSSPGTAAAAAVLPLFAVQLDGDGRGGGGGGGDGGGGAPARGRDLPGQLDHGAAPEAPAGTHARRGSRSGGGAPTPALAPAPTGAAPPALLDSTAAWLEWQTAHARTDAATAAVQRRVATGLDDVRAAHAPARVQAQAESAQGEVELQLLLAEARKELARLKKSNNALEHQYMKSSHVL